MFFRSDSRVNPTTEAAGPQLVPPHSLGAADGRPVIIKASKRGPSVGASDSAPQWVDQCLSLVREKEKKNFLKIHP